MATRQRTPRQWQVRSGDARGRILFEGDEKSARTHIQNNFPRLHNEPGVYYDDGPPPDAYLHSPLQNTEPEYWNGDEWINPNAQREDNDMSEPTEPTPTDPDTGNDEENVDSGAKD